MCLGIPGRIIAVNDPEGGSATVEMGGQTRQINIQLLAGVGDAPAVGDWVLVHLGLAVEKLTEEQAREAHEILEFLVPPTETP